MSCVDNNQNGNTLLSVLVSVAIGAILLTGMNALIMQDLSLSNVSDIIKLKAEVNEQAHCRNSYFPPPDNIYASACINNFSYYDTPCGTAPYLPVLNVKGKPIFRDWNGEPKRLGNFEVRSCCTSGQLKVEYRIVKNGQPMKDRSNANIVYEWASSSVPYSSLKSYDKGILFPYGSPCGSSETTPTVSNVSKIQGDLRPTAAACPGYPWMESPTLVLWAYEGIVQCPNGTKLIGGGVNCAGLGPAMIPARSGTADSHPIMETNLSGSTWIDSAVRYGAGCCAGVPASGSLRNKVYALCERVN